MEMRAIDDTCMARDVTPPLPPIAAALHDHLLRSHCSSCLRPLNLPHPLPHSACSAAVSYCSASCSAADLPLHVSSGECSLLRSRPLSAPTTDARVSLRLLLHLRRSSPARIGGLWSNREAMKEEEEVWGRVEEGVALMMSIADRRVSTEEEAEAAMCVVVTNAVEVQFGTGPGPVGIALYGPGFSWFNHSCSPNACYRFVPAWPGPVDPDSFRVSPAGEESALKAWICDENRLYDGFCRYGPRIVVRSIKPIRKGEEVCVGYLDLLQPKQQTWGKNGSSLGTLT
ncbi:Protein SET DOMAIN GROUP 41 [Acorus gramineus]|uniref:Protein SET DOMAIN GROUP 41 n=1 Tax=Acorus gramineus TaxID=55184 RepID=A0AAV9AHC6_ACOGR|nr:Protein SET DOMAIN GROUP 41 [Acorus gramineus]